MKYIKIKNEKMSNIIQQLLINNGYCWSNGEKTVFIPLFKYNLIIDKKNMKLRYCPYDYKSEWEEYEKISFEELLDLLIEEDKPEFKVGDIWENDKGEYIKIIHIHTIIHYKILGLLMHKNESGSYEEGDAMSFYTLDGNGVSKNLFKKIKNGENK